MYIRVMDGTVRPGDKILLMSTGAQFEVTEVGALEPFGMQKLDCLQAGDVGYITASIKTVSDTRVGDTITHADRPCSEALPGFKSVQPMVYAGIYPADGAKYNETKDALEKLRLNDAALTFEPETSAALGFGFRCGFLGLLHMEIIEERLEREFNLDLITTAPSVIYEIKKRDGTVLEIDNPSNFPPPEEIESAGRAGGLCQHYYTYGVCRGDYGFVSGPQRGVSGYEVSGHPAGGAPLYAPPERNHI